MNSVILHVRAIFFFKCSGAQMYIKKNLITRVIVSTSQLALKKLIQNPLTFIFSKKKIIILLLHIYKIKKD